MLSHTGEQKTSSLGLHLTQEDICHRLAVSLIQVADGFVGQQEVEGLHQGSHQGHALLLSEAHAAYGYMHLVGYAQPLKPFLDFFVRLEVRQAVLDVTFSNAVSSVKSLSS